MAAQEFILLLLAAISMAHMDSFSGIRWKSPGRERAVPAQCTERGLFCSNCQESYFCGSADGTPVPIPCQPDEICDLGSGGAGQAGCRSYTGTNSAGECDCDTIDNSGLLADPFDDSRYFICIPNGEQFLATCNTGFVFSTAEQGCVEDTTTSQNDSSIDCRAPGVTNGFYTNDPTCETYTLCINRLPGIPFACSDGEAFDTSASRCVDKCTLGPSTFACPEGSVGAFPDTSDCTIFHVCSNGLFVPNLQCPDGELFEPTSMMCLPASTSIVCPVINPCWAAHCDECTGTCPETVIIPSTTRRQTDSTTVSSGPNDDPSPTTPSTTTTRGTDVIPNCNNGPGYFEYSTDCKQFWSCQDNDAGGYEAILYRCPGPLVFIPASRHCSIQADLPAAPGCITS